MGKFLAQAPFHVWRLLQQCCPKSENPKRKLPVNQKSLHISSTGSNREIQTLSKYHLYQRKMREKDHSKFSLHFVTLEETIKKVALLS